MNVIYENVKGIQVADLVNFMNLFITSLDDVVNYDDFIKIIYKFGEMPLQHATI